MDLSAPTLTANSPAYYFRTLPLSERLKRLAKLTPSQRTALLYDWTGWWARPNQLAPTDTAEGAYWRFESPDPTPEHPAPKPRWLPAVPRSDWTYWLVCAGRGFGKTRTGAEWVRRKIRTTDYVNLIAPTSADLRRVMIEGPSGILAVCPDGERPLYKPGVGGSGELHWPNGAKSLLFSADEPDRLRGPAHGALWADELASWRYADAWDQAQFGLRLGDWPQACITTTPKVVPVFKAVLSDPGAIVSRGTTRENAINLARPFLSHVVGKYAGTRLGRQELDADLLEDNAGALWRRSVLDSSRVAICPPLQQVVVGVDPMGSVANPNAECGIVVAGVGDDGDGYVIADSSIHGKPNEWGLAAAAGYSLHQADWIVAETNFGGDMVEGVLTGIAPGAAFKAVTASRGKRVRAEPVAALYEQGRIHHVGFFPQLEDELCDWDPTDSKAPSPNRLDALVWAFTKLMLGESTTGMLDYLRQQQAGNGHASPPVLPSSGVIVRQNTFHDAG